MSARDINPVRRLAAVKRIGRRIDTNAPAISGV